MYIYVLFVLSFLRGLFRKLWSAPCNRLLHGALAIWGIRTCKVFKAGVIQTGESSGREFWDVLLLASFAVAVCYDVWLSATILHVLFLGKHTQIQQWKCEMLKLIPTSTA